jgi:hypothetical protein
VSPKFPEHGTLALLALGGVGLLRNGKAFEDSRFPFGFLTLYPGGRKPALFFAAAGRARFL